MGHSGHVSNSRTIFNRKVCLVLLQVIKAVKSITVSNTGNAQQLV